jgi:hypothetical protein
MEFDHLTESDILAFFQSPQGKVVLQAARGEMTVAEIFSLAREETELVRAFMVFWAAARA